MERPSSNYSYLRLKHSRTVVIRYNVKCQFSFIVLFALFQHRRNRNSKLDSCFQPKQFHLM